MDEPWQQMVLWAAILFAVGLTWLSRSQSRRQKNIAVGVRAFPWRHDRSQRLHGIPFNQRAPDGVGSRLCFSHSRADRWVQEAPCEAR